MRLNGRFFIILLLVLYRCLFMFKICVNICMVIDYSMPIFTQCTKCIDYCHFYPRHPWTTSNPLASCSMHMEITSMDTPSQIMSDYQLGIPVKILFYTNTNIQ